jgi:GNAT superfamily N-acetyltransferase
MKMHGAPADPAAVRPAIEADCTMIHSIHAAATRGLPASAAGSAGVEEFLKSRNPTAYADDMQRESFIVAERAGEVVGWGAFHADKTEITNVFVSPAQQRTGIGTAVITALEDLARAAGFDQVQLQATGTAIDFYLLKGYQSDPPVQPGADWALMKKAL